MGVHTGDRSVLTFAALENETFRCDIEMMRHIGDPGFEGELRVGVERHIAGGVLLSFHVPAANGDR